MASNSTVAHRFVNKDYKSTGLKGSSTHISGKNYYSYSTVFGQWVDEKVCLVYSGHTSNSSSKHQLSSYYFPDDVVVLPYDDGGRGGYYSWHGCDLLGYSDEFKYEHRIKLLNYWLSEITNALCDIKGGKKKGLGGIADNIINQYWPYVLTLCKLYKDTTIGKWLKTLTKEQKRLVNALKDGETRASVLVDVLLGDGTYKAYYDYCARYRKAEDKRSFVIRLCKRLGIKSPYTGWEGYDKLDTGKNADQIRKMSAKERNELHFLYIATKKWKDGEHERDKKAAESFRNAFAWITGSEPQKRSWGVGYDNEVKIVRNMYTGELYNVKERVMYGYRFKLWGLDFEVKFEFDEFRKAENKEEWIRNFYAKCKEVQDNNEAVSIFDRFGDAVYTDQKIDYSPYRIFVDNDVLKAGTTEEEHALCVEFIEKWNVILHDKEARYRAEQLERERRKEEERKEKELQERIKQEQIDACIARGIEGCRDIWRLHYEDIYNARMGHEKFMENEFFYGGNVLMRFSMNKDKIETSKSIVIDIPTCKKMWRLVSLWHEHPEKFREMSINTHYSGTYTISSYRNDIMTAGCHKIAYAEMEHMWNEIVKLENEAA